MSRLLIVDSDTSLAAGLRSSLELEGHLVRTAANGIDGLQLAHSWQPDLVITELRTTDVDGYRLLRRLRQDDDPVLVLVVSRRADEADKVRALQLGADDYVTKPFHLLELLARIEALLRRQGTTRRLGRERFAELEIRYDARRVLRAGKSIDLTPKEFDLLAALARRHGAVASRGELLEEVWGYSERTVTRTIDAHVSSLRAKLSDDSSDPRFIQTVRKIGYRFQAEPDLPEPHLPPHHFAHQLG